MSYENRQKQLDIAAKEYVDLMNGSGYVKQRVLVYGGSFLVSPFLTSYLIAEDMICSNPVYSIKVESKEQSRGFSEDSRDGKLYLDDEPKSPQIISKRTNRGTMYVVPFLCISFGLGFLLNDVDKNIAEQFGCNSLKEKTGKDGVGLENIVNSCTYDVYKNLEKKFDYVFKNN